MKWMGAAVYISIDFGYQSALNGDFSIVRFLYSTIPAPGFSDASRRLSLFIIKLLPDLGFTCLACCYGSPDHQ